MAQGPSVTITSVAQTTTKVRNGSSSDERAVIVGLAVLARRS